MPGFEHAWIAVGDQKNWERGFENGIWGLIPKHQNKWSRLQTGDLVLFYCTAPIKGFIGAGVIRSKFRQTTPYWKEELEAGRVIWPFRFEFDISHLLPLSNWPSQSVSNKPFNLAILAGLNPVPDPQRALRVLEKLQFAVIRPDTADKDTVTTLFEIGKIQRMVVEIRLQVEDNYLDVIWKRTIRSVPTFAFAVNAAGSLSRSMQPLKYAHDVWNSRPFLVTESQRVNEARERADLLHHGFSDSLKILTSAHP